MAQWLFDLAKKVDEKTVDGNYIMPQAQLHYIDCKPMIMYDEHHVDRIHAQHMMSDENLKYIPEIDVDKMVSIRLAEGITDEIMRLHGDKIEKEVHTGPYGNQTCYSLDVYVCKPKKRGPGPV